LTALNDFSKQKLENVPRKKAGNTLYDFIPSPFKLLFLSERLYTPLLIKIGIERYFYVNAFFSIYTVDSPFISLYLDHKIADDVSTYKKALTYGPIIPSNFDLIKFFQQEEDILNLYDVFNYCKQNCDITKLINDFNTENNTIFTKNDCANINNVIFNKLMESENLIDKESQPYIQFRPFINGCKDNQKLIANINDPEIINLDYLLFMAPDDCIKGPCKSINNNMYFSLQQIVENSQMSKQKAVEISDRLNNLSCPESWYKSGEFQMTCL
jgi:hypothetical protein